MGWNMTPDTELDEELDCGVSVKCRRTPEGKLNLRVETDGKSVEDGEYSTSIFTEPTYRAQFLSTVENSLESKDIDEETARTELKEWLADMAKIYREESARLLPPQIQKVLEGTEAVEILGGDPTTVHVTLTWQGETRELEFTADQMTGGGDALVSQMANKFYEFGFECGSEDWEVLVDEWQDRAHVAGVVSETGEETVAGRVLEYIAHDVVPVTEKEKLENGPASAWVDIGNTAGAPGADQAAPVVWVEKTFLIDQMKRAGKPPEYLGQLIKTLNQRGDLYGVPSEPRQRWPNSQGKERVGFYPFRPAAVGVDVEDLPDDPTEESAHSEVEP